jgi:lycopene cyclase domain-containing protein
MMHLSYLTTLLLALGCVGLVDRRWRLVLWCDGRRGAAVLASGVVFFLAWDVVAVRQGFYRRGGDEVMTGLQVAADVPVEEVFFVAFLCYVTVVLHTLVHRLLSARLRTEDGSR